MVHPAEESPELRSGDAARSPSKPTNPRSRPAGSRRPPSSPTGRPDADARPTPKTGGPPKRRLADADRLVKLVTEAKVELVHTPDQEAFALIPVEGRCEVYPVTGTPFKRWLRREFFMSESRAVNAQAMASAVGALESIAVFGGQERAVHLRVAPGPDGGLVLDLCDDRWRAVVIQPGAWEVVDRPPVLFRRSPQMRPLPAPERGGDLRDLRSFLNLKPGATPQPGTGDIAGAAGGVDPADSNWLLLVAWLAAALRPRGPYPVLHLRGEQGSAKSTGGRVIRRLFDPAGAELRSQPREERDLAVASKHGWAVCFDNLSAVPVWLSDALCRVATGGGFGARTLYTDQDETVFEFTRPVLVTSVEDVIGQPDLLDRCLGVELARIPDEARRTEEQLWGDFEAALPGILGGLLDVVERALELLPAVRAEDSPLPRLADFALLGEAVARALGEPPGRFLELMADARAGADQSTLEASPIAATLYRFLMARDGQRFTGTYTTLLEELNAAASDAEQRRKWWPASAQALSNLVRRIGPALDRVGVRCSSERVGKARTRTVTLWCARRPSGYESSAGPREHSDAWKTASAASADPATLFPGNGFGADDGIVRPSSADRPPVRGSSADSPHSTGLADAADDGADARRTMGSSAPNHLAGQGVNGEADAADDLLRHPTGSERNGATHRFRHSVSGDVEEGTL